VTKHPTDWGTATESYARHLAGDLGVPDFVYEPTTERKGSATREISDGILACGADGLIIQIKARDRDAAFRDTPEKAARWGRKVAEEGRGQASGTRRRLAVGNVTLQSLRGYSRTFDAAGTWPAVVVIAHPNAPPMLLPQYSDTMWIALHDWLGLHERLRSTAAVIGYVERALGSPMHPPLGAEALRYDALAAADEAAFGGPNSAPLLPRHSLEGEDLTAALFITDLIEKVWEPDGFYPWTEPDQYRKIVEDLDRIPPAIRADIGRKMWVTFNAMLSTGQRRSFLYWDGSQSGVFAVVYDRIDRWKEAEPFLEMVVALAQTRFAHATESDQLTPRFALGVGVLHDDDRGRSYSFAHVETVVGLESESRRIIEEEFGVFTGSTIEPPATPPQK
jgi:hypothetical protein